MKQIFLLAPTFIGRQLLEKTKTGKNNEPVDVETKFGCVLNGPVTGFEASTNLTFETEHSHVLPLNTEQSVRNENVDFNVNRFWDLETIGIREKENANLRDFQDFIQLNDEGRQEARLPFKESHETLPDNYSFQEKRLLKLYSKRKNDRVLLKNYDALFVEQREAGIIETVESTSTLGECHYIAHHPVFREDKKASKLRIVFDASAKENGASLNEVLYKGQQIIPLIFDILIRFRTYDIALTSYIEKASHQVSAHEKDRELLRFL